MESFFPPPAQGSLLFNACNKSLELACWMLRRMRVYLAALQPHEP